MFNSSEHHGGSRNGKDETLLRFSDRKDAEYLAELGAAIYQFQGQEIGAKTISRYLSQEKLAEFNLVNPYARKVFREHLLMEVADVEGGQFPTGGAIMLATFADYAWACCDRALNFDFDRAKQKIRNALSGMDYIAAIEGACTRIPSGLQMELRAALSHFTVMRLFGAQANLCCVGTKRR